MTLTCPSSLVMACSSGEAKACPNLNWWLASLTDHALAMKGKTRLALPYYFFFLWYPLLWLSYLRKAKFSLVWPKLSWLGHEGSQALPGLTLPSVSGKPTLACFSSSPYLSFLALLWLGYWGGNKPGLSAFCHALPWDGCHWEAKFVSLFLSLPLALLWRGSQAFAFLVVLSYKDLTVEGKLSSPCPMLLFFYFPGLSEGSLTLPSFPFQV